MTNNRDLREKCCQTKPKSQPANHPTLATLYNNIGEIHRTTEQFSTALTFYENSLNI